MHLFDLYPSNVRMLPVHLHGIRLKEVSTSFIKSQIIEIAKCQLERIPPALEELDSLMTLCLSYNNIRPEAFERAFERPFEWPRGKFSPELARCEALERIVLVPRNHEMAFRCVIEGESALCTSIM